LDIRFPDPATDFFDPYPDPVSGSNIAILPDSDPEILILIITDGRMM